MCGYDGSYARELAEQERLMALYDNQPGARSAAIAQKTVRLTTEAIFPLARIKRTMKLDPEVRNIKPEAAMTVGKALELFLGFMAVRVGHIAATHKRRTVKRSDVVELIHRNAAISFLKGDFPVEQKKKKKTAGTRPSGGGREQTAALKAAAGSSKITGFFQQQPKATPTVS